MFCPVCRSEYRPGFSRCPSCEVDLVEEAQAAGAHSTESGGRQAPRAAGPMVEYCGFLSLDEAREARSRLRREKIVSEIVIRDGEDADSTGSFQEEYWLRVPSDVYKATAAVLGYDFDDSSAGERGEDLSCSDCGKNVGAEEVFCPHCGSRFE